MMMAACSSKAVLHHQLVDITWNCPLLTVANWYVHCHCYKYQMMMRSEQTKLTIYISF